MSGESDPTKYSPTTEDCHLDEGSFTKATKLQRKSSKVLTRYRSIGSLSPDKDCLITTREKSQPKARRSFRKSGGFSELSNSDGQSKRKKRKKHKSHGSAINFVSPRVTKKSRSLTTDAAFEVASQPEDSDPDFVPTPVVWTKNPEAEAIREMISKQMESGTDKRNTIEIERKLEEILSPRSSLSTQLEQSLSSEKIKARSPSLRLRDTARRMKTRSVTSAQFSIVRDNDAPLKMITELQREFSDFSQEKDSNRSSEPSMATNPTISPRRTQSSTIPGANIDKRTQILLEIRSSERSYVHHLTIIVDNYFKPMREHEQNNDSSNFDCASIFSNIRAIKDLHTCFLKQLDEKVIDWTQENTIGSMFCDLVPKLKLYSEYGSNYEVSLATLSKSTKKPEFSQILNECFEASDTNLKLESLLISPIQRIPRYILLLADLQRSTAPEHKDYNELAEAIKGMQETAAQINKHVNQSKFKKSFEKIVDRARVLNSKNRVMIYEIIARCEIRKKNISLYVFNDMFIHLSENKAKYTSNLSLTKYQWPLELVWIQERKDVVKIIGPDGRYKFKISDVIEMLNPVRNAIIDRLKELELPESLDVSSPFRFGCYSFLEQQSVFDGKWKNGKPLDGTYSHMGTIYKGELTSERKKHGNGSQTSFFKDHYTGNWANNRPHGKGVFIDAEENTYSGFFDNGLKHGQGTMKFSSGAIYEGSWVRDTPQGVGSMMFASGAVYAGNWENGRFHHYGVLTKGGSLSKYKYEGMWSYGLKEGTGRLTSDEETYDGSWKADLQEGFGRETNQFGFYEGEWIAGMKDGKGTFKAISGSEYSGQWKRNLYHGTGKLTTTTGIVRSFEGEWQQGRKNGKGIIVFYNGDSYEGLFRDDTMHGSGVYTKSNGCTFDGKWNRGFLDGKVIYTRVKDTTRKTFTGTCKDNFMNFVELPEFPLELCTAVSIQDWDY